MRVVLEDYIDASKLKASTRSQFSCVQGFSIVLPSSSVTKDLYYSSQIVSCTFDGNECVYPAMLYLDKRVKIPSILNNGCHHASEDAEDLEIEITPGCPSLVAKDLVFSLLQIVFTEHCDVDFDIHIEEIDVKDKPELNDYVAIMEFLKSNLIERKILLKEGMKVMVKYLCQKFIFIVKTVKSCFYANINYKKCAFMCLPLTNIEINMITSVKTKNCLDWNSIGGRGVELQNFCQNIDLVLLDGSSKFLNKGILITGPSGSGKTLVGDVLKSMYPEKCLRISSEDIKLSHRGDAEQTLWKLYQKAYSRAPCIILIDDLDKIFTSRDSGGDFRVVAALLNLIDKVHNTNDAELLVIGTASSPQTLDSALMRPGRLSYEITLKNPNEDERREIIELLLNRFSTPLTVDSAIIADAVAPKISGYTGGDIQTLIMESTLEADFENVTVQHFIDTLQCFKPMSLKSVNTLKSKVTFDDVCGCADVKNDLQNAFNLTSHHRKLFLNAGITPPTRFLLFGPPGNGKTMITQALANHFNLPIIPVKRSDVFGKYFGESEKNLAKLFEQAEKSSPCLLHFKSFDGLAGRKSRASEVSSEVEDRIINHMKVLLDGVVAYENIFIVAETNRPDLLDKDVVRPGRFHHYTYIGLPSPSDRENALRTFLSDIRIFEEVFSALVEETDGYTLSEIKVVCNEIKNSLEVNNTNGTSDFGEEQILSTVQECLDNILPNTSKKMLKKYKDFCILYCNK